MHGQFKEVSLPHIRTAFGWRDPTPNDPTAAALDVSTFWGSITGGPLHRSGDQISAIRHPALRIAACFLTQAVCCKGETGKINQKEMALLRCFLPGPVGFPDWARIWIDGCLAIRDKESGNISMGA